MKLKRQTMLKRSKRKGSRKRMTKRAKMSVSISYKKGRGGAPASYVGSIQGNFINDRGQQLFRNPVRGIA